MLSEFLRYFFQALVALRVAVTIVEGFEVVNVDQEQRETELSSQGSLPLDEQLFVEVSPIVNAGEPVANGLLAEAVNGLEKRQAAL